MKKLFYKIFAVFFNIFKIVPIDKNKIMFIMTHDSSINGNLGCIYRGLNKQKLGYKFYFITKEDYIIKAKHNRIYAIRKFINLFLIKSFHLATANNVILDNVFLPSAYFKYKKEVNVVQVWHAAGAFKKFGQHIKNNTELYELEKKADSTYTHLVVNSEKIVDIYAEAFNIKVDKVHPIGIPRDDLFFNENKMNEIKENFFRSYPYLKDKKIILYAPTFRDDEIENVDVNFDFRKFHENFGEEYIILLRLHPYIANKYSLNKEFNNFVYNFSSYNEINDLLIVSDVLITDYSSIIFEYSLLNKEMIFYAYDLEKYENQTRGFYYPYKEFVPGPIVYNMEDLIEIFKRAVFDIDKIKDFANDNYDYFDGKATERLIELILKK